MKTWPFAFLALLLAACGGTGLAGGPDGSSTDPCAAHEDYASCTADTACFADGCGVCGGFDFLGCHTVGTAVPGHSCPNNTCAPSCSQHTDAASCSADPECSTFECSACDGSTTFNGCYDASSLVAPACPQTGCEAQACAQLTDQASCEAVPSCHAIFGNSPAQCAGPDGGCLAFERCDGQPVVCSQTPSDGGATSCTAAPVCSGAYAPAYEGPCQVGCVHASLCSTN